jgi:hypothetical protein
MRQSVNSGRTGMAICTSNRGWRVIGSGGDRVGQAELNGEAEREGKKMFGTDSN